MSPSSRKLAKPASDSEQGEAGTSPEHEQECAELEYEPVDETGIPAIRHPFSGLILFGKIVGRRRRTIIVQKTGEELEIVTYRVLSEDHVDEIQCNAKHEYLRLDQIVALPCFVRCYSSKSGAPMYSLSMKGSNDQEF